MGILQHDIQLLADHASSATTWDKQRLSKYRRNKVRTAFDIVRRVHNWPTAWAMRLHRRRNGLRLLRMRNGINLICRSGTRDWDVIHELFFAESYGQALRYLSELAHTHVLDLGANIGFFSLLAALSNPRIFIHAFEPGPPNLRLLKMNCLANPELGSRITIHRDGLGGETREANWFFDEKNPGGSSLFGSGGCVSRVSIRSFSEVMAEMSDPIALVKIDIEGAEYGILEQTPPEVWRRIPAISLELHVDPAGQMSNKQFLARMEELGYHAEPERVCSYFLTRRS